MKRFLLILAFAGLIPHANAQTYPGQTQCFNILQFGGSGNNSTDNTAALNAALAALTSPGGCIFFPPDGQYKFNSGITYTLPSGIFSVTLAGGGQDNTILTWPSGSGGIQFNYNDLNSSVHVRDLSLTTGTTAGGNALSLSNPTSNASPAYTSISDIYRVTCRGDDGYSVTDYWSSCINIGNVSNVQIENLSVNGASTPNGIGVNLVGLPGSSTYGVVYNIAKSTFNNLASGIVYGSFIQGVTVDQSNFTSNNGTSIGIQIPAAQTGTLTQLAVINSQFNVPTNAIGLSTAIGDVQLVNNLCIARANSNCFNLGSVASFTITGNIVAASSTTSTNGIVIGGSGADGTINDNFVSGFGTGILIQANAVGVTVNGNGYAANTTAVLNQSNSLGNFGLDLAAIAFTPSYTCGTATFTNNSSKFKTTGKQTWAQVDLTITAIGTCANVLTFTLPNSALSTATLVGQEVAEATNPRDTVVCSVGGGTTATCVRQGAHSYLVNDRVIVSGVYENQ